MTTEQISLLLFTLLIAVGCYPRKRNVALNDLSKVMELHKNACFGKCPVYGLIIYENGKATYNGKMHVEKLGLYSKQLSKQAFKAIRKAFQQADIWQYEDQYKSDVHDLPFVTLRHHKRDKMKAVGGDIARPEAVKALEKQMDAIANSDGWTLLEALEEEMDNSIIPGELIVRFHPSADIPDWIHSMEKYNADR